MDVIGGLFGRMIVLGLIFVLLLVGDLFGLMIYMLCIVFVVVVGKF